MAEYQKRLAELTALGVSLAALSVDPPERSLALTEQLGLGFPLLCDQQRQVVEAWSLYNREEKGGIAYPATFVFDRQRTVRFRSLDRMKSRADLDGVFAFLRAGVESTAPAEPKRASISPSFREIASVLRNAIRFGIKSPKV